MSKLLIRTLLKEIFSEDTSDQDYFEDNLETTQQQYLEDTLIPFLVQLPQAKSIKDPRQLHALFVKRLEAHPEGSDLDLPSRSYIAKLALQQLGLVKDTKQLPF